MTPPFAIDDGLHREVRDFARGRLLDLSDVHDDVAEATGGWFGSTGERVIVKASAKVPPAARTKLAEIRSLVICSARWPHVGLRLAPDLAST